MRALALSLALAATPALATVTTYVQDDAGDNQLALGYPVPRPGGGLEPFAGFRTYDNLVLRLQALDLASPNINGELLGHSEDGREILGFAIGDTDTLSADGQTEAAILHNGGIHAREWQAMEAVTGIIETLAAKETDRGFHQYLVENLQLLLIPVLNVDGFVQTQRFPDRTLLGLDSQQGPDAPRDGRQRRKNMRDADAMLDSEDDALFGVDLNRNFDPFWAVSSGGRSSDDPESIVHHGAGPASEAASRALLTAVERLPSERLRLFIDTHSFGRVLFGHQPPNARLTALTRELAAVMGAVASPPYNFLSEPADTGIGATDEGFAYEYQVPSYTLEIEPGINGAREYGGFGVSHDGFIQPEAEVPRMRAEVAAMSLLAYYRQAGPPSLEAIEIRDVDDGSLRYSARWSAGPGPRSLQIAQQQSLFSGRDYRLWLAFNKPMRVRDGGGEIANYPGRSVALAPALRLIGSNASQTLVTDPEGWRGGPDETPDGFLRYRDDAFTTEFRLANELSGGISLEIAVADLSGLALDADPATPVDWSDGHWSGYEDGEGREGDSGGADQNITLSVSGGPPSTPPAGGSGSGAEWLLLLAAMLRRRQ